MLLLSYSRHVKSVLSALALAASALSAHAVDAGVTDTEIRLGASAVLSGPLGPQTVEYGVGSRLYFDAINQSGGIHGRKISYTTLDDAFDVKQAVENTRKLLQEQQVFMIYNNTGTGHTAAILPLAAETKTVVFSPVTGAAPLRDNFNRYLFHVRASYADEARYIQNQLQQMGIQRVALFYQDDAFGKALQAEVTKAAAASGVTLVAEVAVNPKEPPLSRCCSSLASLLDQASGGDVGTGETGIDIALGLYRFGAAFARGHLLGQDALGQTQQGLGQRLRVLAGRAGPMLCGHRDEHALVAAFDLHRQVVGGDLQLQGLLAVGVLDGALQQRQHVVGQHGHRKAQQRRAWMAQTLDLAVQHRLQTLEHAFDAPAFAVQLRQCGRIHRHGQIRPQANGVLTGFGGTVQGDLDAPPCAGLRSWPGGLGLRRVRRRGLRCLLAASGWLDVDALDRDGLLAHRARVGALGFAPVPLLGDPGVFGMFAHEKVGSRAGQTVQDGMGAEVAVCYPQLPALRTLDQGQHPNALALVGILARDHVAHQSCVRIVDHQAVAGQGRPSVPAQHLQAFVAGRQVVAVHDAQLPPCQTHWPTPLCHHWHQALGAATDEPAQHRWLAAVDLVVQRRQRYRQPFVLAGRRVQRWPHAQRDQRHEFDNA